MAASDRLKLRARDPDDVRVIAGVLQDALVPLKDVAYLKRENRFVMVANRFRWEGAGRAAEGMERSPEEPVTDEQAEDAAFDEDAEPAPYERINCGVCFDRVTQVRFKGLDLKQRDQFLNLLTVDTAPGAVTLLFSDGAAIRLDVTGIACHLEDLGEAWPTRWRPQHRLDGEDGKG
ncbi:MAG: DUF2948 family protein [Kiloniellales bacterium]|nr:DUF2948 family protein [Kiloniellales bacterium]